MPKSETIIVAVLHTGARYSWCAYSFKNNPTELFFPLYEETHTSVLVDDTGQLNSFGLQAEWKYASCVDEHKDIAWRLFWHFTIQIHDKTILSEQTVIQDYEGNNYSAIEIFTMAIKYLHGRLMETSISKFKGIYETDVKYVIPVPANWHSSAEQFIRIAAKNAGIDQDRLEIVFEDQAAAKWCTSDAGPVSRLGGCKYMIIYLGGTSAEIIVHKQMVSGNIEEEHCSSCWQWNETYIDQKFSLYLENLVGKEALQEFRKNEISEYLSIHNRVLNIMLNFKSGGNNRFRVRLPPSLSMIVFNKLNGLLCIDSSEIISWLEDVTKPLLEDIKTIVSQDKMKEIRTIVLVGESSNSEYIRDKFREELPGITLIIPEDSTVAAMKGAVLYGHNPDNSRKFLVAAAFDLGSAYSGYAYSFTYDPNIVFTNQNWCSGGSSASLVTLKTPSSVLLDDKGRFHSFGFEAENEYAALAKQNKTNGWRLFRQFKLHYAKYTARISTVKDMQGQPYSARKIFSIAIGYLHEHLLKALKQKSPDIIEANIRYVITVPTTWGPEAHQDMREIAKEAGLDNNRLSIAFEDQAAAKWCTRSDGPAPNLKTTGSKYMIIDLGGGSTEITVQERVADSDIKVLRTESIGTCNGIRVDEEFQQYLEKILGRETLTNCKRKDIDDYFEIMRRFEAKLRTPVFTSKLELLLPTSLLKIARALNTKEVDTSGKLQIPFLEVSSWFEKITKPLVETMKTLVNEINVKSAETIFLVGSLAESKYIQDRLKEELPKMRLVLPENSGLAVLRGAVLYGHDPDHGYMTSLVVAAFDFGTTYSGYAYSYRHNPTEVHTNESWYTGGASSQLVSLKTATCVLLDDKGKFNSFGFEAEDKFAALTMQRKNEGWRLFRRFKMHLHNIKNLSRNLTIEDIEGKPYPAMDIISMALRYLHNHLLEAFRSKKPSILETDFQYIITVPAIWDVAAKQFMREAAIKAGIDDRRLALALEPEAAAIWCGGLGIKRLSSGSKYIVIDLGGGTADITVFLSLSDDNIRVIHKATGGAWGGTCVDNNFLAYLDRILGPGVLDELSRERLYDYYCLIREFETKKRSGTFFLNAGCVVPITSAMKVIVNKRQSDGQAGSALGDWLEIESCEVKAWFGQPISSLIEHVKELRKDKEIRDIKNIVLVGGFAESKFVKDRFRIEFSGLTLIVPDAAGLAVLRGAVLYGHNPGIVSSRVMSHTYGISLYNDFDGSKHPLEKRILVYGKLRVANCFKIFVRVNESIAVVHEVTHTTIPVDNTTETSFCVYRTLSENPMYTTDPGCELLGKLRIKNIANVPLHDQEHIVTFMFGHSELLVKVKHTLTGDIETLTLDCLQ